MTEEEKKIIFLLAQKLTGAHPDGTFQHGIFITNVERRMHIHGITSLSKYLAFAKENEEENKHLISTLSIHTTAWFRENPHYVILQRILLSRKNKTEPFRMWSCACSSGEEVYSFAVLFEEFKNFHNEFNYSILGTDVDPVSLKAAKRAVYKKENLTSPLSYYKKHVLLGSQHTENYFTFTKNVRQNCEFKVHDIRNRLDGNELFDLIVCRNVLIYFPPNEIEKIVKELSARLRPGGHLILGHSEMISSEKIDLTLIGHAVYAKDEQKKSRSLPPTVRAQTPPPKILKKIAPGFTPEVILIGASTGGPQAITTILGHLNSDSPPVVIVQHISAHYAKDFAKNLSMSTGFELGESKDMTKLEKGHLYLADGRFHIGVEQTSEGTFLRQVKGDPINGHCPSVDYLFSSAQSLASKCIAILLSGMGYDGAVGIELLHGEGAYTVAQSEADSVVFGMPKEAIERNAIDCIGSSEQIGELLGEVFKRSF